MTLNPQMSCLYTANSIDYVIAKWEARHAAMNFAMTLLFVRMCVCMYVHNYVHMHHTFNCHTFFWSTFGTTENGLHHNNDTKEKTAS